MSDQALWYGDALRRRGEHQDVMQLAERISDLLDDNVMWEPGASETAVIVLTLPQARRLYDLASR